VSPDGTGLWAILSLAGIFVTALASLGVALINTRKTASVQRTVDGQLSEFLARWEAEHEARMVAELELARLHERLRDEP
jgi:hypothetical protein